jgi:multidrug efflux pump subunit AcrA (membrane-fusion protein)
MFFGRSDNIKGSIATAVRLLAPLAGLILLTACGSRGAQATPTPFPTPVVPEKPTYTVERGSVVKSLEFRGRVSPVTEQELFFETDGYVRDAYVSQGDLVKEGDLLAELEISDLENQLAQADIALKTAELRLSQAEQETTDALDEAEIALEKARLQLAQTQAEDVNADVTIAQIDVSQALQSVADAEQEYKESLERHQEWGERGEPQERVDAYARALNQARDNLTASQARYDQALTARHNYTYTVQLQGKEVELTELRVATLARGVDPLLAQEVQKARIDLQRINGQIEDARLVAPFDGRILSMSIREGNLVTAFKTALVLGDPGALEVTAELSADELTQMSVDQPATIRLLNRPDQDYPGRVRQLPYPYGGGGGSQTEDNTTTRIALDDPTVMLEIGELASVEIFLEQRDDVLWLPPAAVRTFQGRDFAVVQEGDVQRRVDVKVGLESEDRVEILEGVEEGQVVVGE